jgi:hypothetical protein
VDYILEIFEKGPQIAVLQIEIAVLQIEMAVLQSVELKRQKVSNETSCTLAPSITARRADPSLLQRYLGLRTLGLPAILAQDVLAKGIGSEVLQKRVPGVFVFA